MTKKLLLLFVVCFASNFAFSQTLEELNATKAAKTAELGALADAVAKADALKADLEGLETKIKNLSGWDFGALGTLGANFSQFNNWGAANQNSFSAVIGATGNAFANNQTEKFFWRNGLNVVLAQTKLGADAVAIKNANFETTADALSLTSLYGYKLNSKWAISALGEYRSTILTKFNNPGFLDIGVGATWTPIPNAVVVFHPLNYNFVFADDDLSFESSLGMKFVADYSQALPMGIAWKTNLSGFLSYTEPNHLSNWAWTNGLSATIYKGLGIGVDFGLRGNKQESYNTFLGGNVAKAQGLTKDNFPIDDLDSSNNPLQSFWILGLTYQL